MENKATLHENKATLNKDNKNKLITIEGNIASGKSTFLELAKNKTDNVEVLCELLEKWKNYNG